MSEHRFTMRLDARYEDDCRAWAKLNDIQRRTHRSFSKIVVGAVNRYDDEHLHLSPDDEEQLVHKITEAVAEKLQQLLPAYLAGYSAASGEVAPPMEREANSGVSKATPLKEQPATESEMPDFADSVMDWSFIG